MLKAHNSGNRYLSQRGVALITAMLVMTLAALTAAALASRQFIDFRRTVNTINYEQAYLDALSMEAIVKGALLAYAERFRYDDPGLMDAAAAMLVGKLAELKQDGQLPDGAGVTLRLVNLEGKFNLNNLLVKNDDKADEVNEVQQRRLRRLMTEVFNQLGEPVAVDEAINAIIDWIDKDEEPRFPGGAEDETYLYAEPGKPAYRTPNRMMSSVTELSLIREFRDRPQLLFGKTVKDPLSEAVTELPGLLKYVTVIPQHGTTINVNAADDLLIMALSEYIDEATLAKIEGNVESTIPGIASSGKKPFDNVSLFKSQVKEAAVAGKNETEKRNIENNVDADLQFLDVESSYFLVQVCVFRGGDVPAAQLQSMIYVDTAGRSEALTISREQLPEACQADQQSPLASLPI